MDDLLLPKLDRWVSESATRDRLAPALSRVVHALAAAPAAPQAWEPLPLDWLGELPSDIKSCWLFALRAGGTFGSERHPNSHQRTIALRGMATFEILRDGIWQQAPVDASKLDPAGRCVSIPSNMWHRIAIGPQDFVSMSFHTVPAHALIEETPVGDDLSTTRQRLYYAASHE